MSLELDALYVVLSSQQHLSFFIRFRRISFMKIAVFLMKLIFVVINSILSMSQWQVKLTH